MISEKKCFMTTELEKSLIFLFLLIVFLELR